MRGGGINEIIISLGNCGRSSGIGFWKNGCITLIHEKNKVVLYYNQTEQVLEVRYFANSNNNVYIGKPLRYTFKQFNIFIFAIIIYGLIHSINYTADNISQIIQTFNFTDNNNIYTLIKRIKRIKRINTKNTMCGDLHCSMVINFLNKLLPKEEQNNKQPINILNQRGVILSPQQIKNQEEKKIRNALEFERLAKEAELARLAQAKRRQLNNIQYRRRLLASLPSVITEN